MLLATWLVFLQTWNSEVKGQSLGWKIGGGFPASDRWDDNNTSFWTRLRMATGTLLFLVQMCKLRILKLITDCVLSLVLLFGERALQGPKTFYCVKTYTERHAWVNDQQCTLLLVGKFWKTTLVPKQGALLPRTLSSFPVGKERAEGVYKHFEHAPIFSLLCAV